MSQVGLRHTQQGHSVADPQGNCARKAVRPFLAGAIAAVRAQLGGGSPNALGPLLEKYWKALGTRIAAGPESLERVPESLARMTEALWLRSLDEARERAKIASLAIVSLRSARRADPFHVGLLLDEEPKASLIIG
jgi:predicted component of type VI protein secretion system